MTDARDENGMLLPDNVRLIQIWKNAKKHKSDELLNYLTF